MGAGVAGLPTAVMLTESKLQPQVTIIAEQFSPNITSDAAIAAIRITDYQSFANDPRKVKWIGETYQYLSKLFPTPLAARLNLSLLPSYAVFDEFKEYPGVKDLVLGFHFISAEEKKRSKHPTGQNCMLLLNFHYTMWTILGLADGAVQSQWRDSDSEEAELLKGNRW